MYPFPMHTVYNGEEDWDNKNSHSEKGRIGNKLLIHSIQHIPLDRNTKGYSDKWKQFIKQYCTCNLKGFPCPLFQLSGRLSFDHCLPQEQLQMVTEKNSHLQGRYGVLCHLLFPYRLCFRNEERDFPGVNGLILRVQGYLVF